MTTDGAALPFRWHWVQPLQLSSISMCQLNTILLANRTLQRGVVGGPVQIFVQRMLDDIVVTERRRACLDTLVCLRKIAHGLMGQRMLGLLCPCALHLLRLMV